MNFKAYKPTTNIILLYFKSRFRHFVLVYTIVNPDSGSTVGGVIHPIGQLTRISAPNMLSICKYKVYLKLVPAVKQKITEHKSLPRSR